MVHDSLADITERNRERRMETDRKGEKWADEGRTERERCFRELR